MTLIVTMDDIRKCGFCAAGIRRWFDAQGIDLRDVRRNGIPASTLAATGDALALKAVQRAQERTNGG